MDWRKIPVKELLRADLEMEAQCSPKELELDDLGLRFIEDAQLAASLTALNQEVTAHFSLSAPIERPCDRCLRSFQTEFTHEWDQNFSLPEDRYIDLMPYIREEFIAEQPILSLCRPDCRGLCAVCGKDLNDGLCQCAKA